MLIYAAIGTFGLSLIPEIAGVEYFDCTKSIVSDDREEYAYTLIASGLAHLECEASAKGATKAVTWEAWASNLATARSENELLRKAVDGFVSEGSQPAELGWGTHERHFPRDGRQHDFGRKSAIFLTQPGCATRVRTWTPRAQAFHGFLITHGESISISDFLTVRQNERAIYRPTVHYAYHPSDNAVLSVHEFCGRNYHLQEEKRIMMGDITTGIDELGVLLAGHAKNAYWYGSQLSIDEARSLAPFNSATSLQVTVAALSGMIWAIENPAKGIVEPDDLDFRRNLEICMPYLGPVVGKYTDWTPLFDRGRLFPEDLDEGDPWQFKNIRV